MKNDRKTPEYVAPFERTQQIEAARSKLRLGSSLRQIKDILGEPDADQILAGKDGKFVARVVYYYLEKWERNLVNEIKDKYLRLEFDESDKLVKVDFK